MRPVGVGVVGLGYWGPQLVRNVAESTCAELVAICDRRDEALAQVGRRHPQARRLRDVSALLDDPDVEAVVIATPIGTHFELGCRVLEAGKHAFVEKPLAASLDQARAMAGMAAELGLVVMPGHTFLYSPPVHAIRRLIASGDLGEIYFVSTSRVNLGLHQSDASVVWDLGPHDFSILAYWLDESPSSVSALSRCCVIPGTPDVAFIHLEYASGVVAHAELAWLAPSKLRRTTVVGSQKMVVYDDTSMEPVRVFDTGVDLPDPGSFGEYRLTYRAGDILSPRIEVTEPLSLELADFCSAIRDGTTPRSSAALGIDVVRVVEAAERSLASGGVRVELDPDGGQPASRTPDASASSP